MARMLYILSVMAWMATGAILILFLLDRPWRDLPDDEITTGSAIEELLRARGNDANNTSERIPPLVHQAQLFAAYLNPPAAPKELRPSTSRETITVASTASDVSPPETSPKFELRGISYHRSKPSESMALVWDATDGHRWIKQGAQLGHIVIEEIRADAVSYSAGSGIREMALSLGQATKAIAEADGKTEPAPKLPDRQSPPVPKWTPVRGIRQMPAERVAAKLGLTSQDVSMP